MNTRHRSIPPLLVGLLACVAVSVPAVAQQATSRVPPAPAKACERASDLARLGDLAQLADLAKLSDLSRLADLAELVDVAGLAADAANAAAQSADDQVSRLLDSREISRLARRSAAARAHVQGQREPRTRRPEQTERFTKTFRVGRNASLYLGNLSGDIIVKAGSGDDIVIDALKRAPQGPDAQRQLNAVTIDAVQQASRVEVRTRYPEHGGDIRTSVDFTVTVPADTALDLHSVSGDVRVTGVKGNLRTDCISGDVIIEGAERLEQVKAVSGDIVVTGGAGTDVRLSSISGELTVRGMKARSLEVTSISGEAKLTDVSADRAVVKTMSGGVEYTGAFARGGHYEFTAQSGDVRLTPTSNTGFELDARSFAGDVRCDVPLTMKPTEVARRSGRREMKGTYGDGSAFITVHTFNGDVIIAKK